MTTRRRLRILDDEQGTTLIETAVACGILLVAMVGLLAMGTVATMHTENEGHLAARTTEYAQDKMEQLLALAYGDVASNTIVFPATFPGGSGLAVGGGTNTDTPVDLYTDWLAYDGTLLGGGTTAPTNWFYERVWKVECAAAACTDTPPTGIKKLTVVTKVRASIGKTLIPKSTLIALKTSQL